MYVLDTDICVFLLRGREQCVAQRLQEVDADEVAVSAITAAELRYGALHSGAPMKNLERVEILLSSLAIVPFDNRAAIHFSSVKQHLASRGELIGLMDLLIASTALAVDAVVVTNNVGEFARVPGLTVENWMV